MGTSTAFGGGNGKNPLIPSWLDDSGSNDWSSPQEAPDPNSNDGPGPAGQPASETNPASPSAPPSVETASPFANRFTSSRTQFNKYVRSGGSDRKNFGKAIASYVSRGGGSMTAARRMSSERTATGRLVGILNAAGQSGIREILRALNLDALATKSIPEIYASLVDVICEPGGDLDEAFARDAYLDAIAEVLELNLADMEKPSPETTALIIERFIANAVHTRILNAVANQLIVLPDSVAVVQSIDRSFREFVRGAVSDALNEVNRSLNSAQMKTLIDGLYERSLSILQVYADAAAEGQP